MFVWAGRGSLAPMAADRDPAGLRIYLGREVLVVDPLVVLGKELQVDVLSVVDPLDEQGTLTRRIKLLGAIIYSESKNVCRRVPLRQLLPKPPDLWLLLCTVFLKALLWPGPWRRSAPWRTRAWPPSRP